MSGLSFKVASALALFVCLAGPAPARQEPQAEQPRVDQRKCQRGDFHLIEGLAVRRTEFLGNAYTADNVIRRKLLLEEGQPFELRLLRKSLDRMNRLGRFEKIAEEHVEWCLDEKVGEVDFSFEFKEKPSARRRR
jgi:outer membrane protein assembly factor BamA